ncbi:ribose-5-phosphate isomerase [Coccinella septempunctata]|uniref:ribose-5-phosphate isomerase n=1 Tax=Coccinella septempunctata TaxID=41139 RepID=UPI001D06EC91|nr:ribose-5-phosphate isomerase [Coccinella septempunctata]
MFLFCRKFVTMSLESAKRVASRRAVDDLLVNNTVVGIGSGSTIVYAVERIAEVVKDLSWNIKCVPTSFQAKQLIHKHNLNLTDLETNPELDICFDGADEVDEKLNLIKGGGGCLLQEKIVASCAKTLVIVADYTKDSTYLGEKYKKGIPLEVVPMCYYPVMNKIKKQFGGTVLLRMAQAKAGPVVTDNGNFILDWFVFDDKFDWEKTNQQLQQMPGIVETGLFIDMAARVYFGLVDGLVEKRVKKNWHNRK